MKSSQIRKLCVDFQFDHQKYEEHYFKDTAIKRKSQSYKGECMMGSYHGVGVYHWDNDLVYEGSFYSNFKDGYATLSFADNSIFEGLFVKNHAFGPGILTYSNGRQDVGFWMDQKLVRLSRTIDYVVPRLAPTSAAKIKLLQFRRLIPVKEDFDPTYESLFEFNYLDDQLFTPYSKFVFDPRSLFFNKILFDKVYFSTDINLLNKWRMEFKPEDIASQKESKRESEVISRRFVNEPRGPSFCMCPDDPVTDFKNKDALEFCKDVSILSEDNLGLLAYYWKHGSLKKTGSSGKNSEEDAESRDSSANAAEQNKKHHAITKIVSWNRNELCINIIKAIFRYRAFEGTLNLNIAKLMFGIRKGFRRTGDREKQCLEFLKTCSVGPLYAVKMFLCSDEISPELMDARGNNSVIFAAANDQREVIDVLLDYGVNVNSFNDEGLTPLNLCLLRRLAKANDVFSWEAAFLLPSGSKVVESSNYEDYLGRESIPSLNKLFGGEILLNDNESFHRHDSHDDTEKEAGSISRFGSSCQLSNTDVKVVPESYKQEDYDSKHRQMSKDHYLFELAVNSPSSKANEFGARRLTTADIRVIEEIDKTIQKLLERGADPNISEVPKPSLHLALFTGNINLVKTLLIFGAHPDSPLHLNEGLLTPLHVLVLLKPSSINASLCRLLLDFGANPDKETTQEFLINEENILLEPYKGRTPLQLLCMRPDMGFIESNDFLLKIAMQLAKVSDKRNFYGGHSYLTLTMLSGNIKLLKTFLENNMFDPNWILENDLGTALHVLVSSAFQKQTPYSISVKMCDLLFEAGANPFLRIERSDKISGTCLDYGYREIEAEKNQRRGSGADKRRNSDLEKSTSRDFLKDHIKLMEYLEKKIADSKLKMSRRGGKTHRFKHKTGAKSKKTKSVKSLELEKKLLFVIPEDTSSIGSGDEEDNDDDEDEDDDDEDDDDDDDNDGDDIDISDDDKDENKNFKVVEKGEKASLKTKKNLTGKKEQLMGKNVVKDKQDIKEKKKRKKKQEDEGTGEEQETKEKKKKYRGKDSSDDEQKIKGKKTKKKNLEKESSDEEEDAKEKKSKKKNQEKEIIRKEQETKEKKEKKRKQDEESSSDEQEIKEKKKKKRKQDEERSSVEQETKEKKKKKRKQDEESLSDERETKGKKKKKRKQDEESSSDEQETKGKKKKKRKGEESSPHEQETKEKKKKKRKQDGEISSDKQEIKGKKKKKRKQDEENLSGGHENKTKMKKIKKQGKETTGEEQEIKGKKKKKKYQEKDDTAEGHETKEGKKKRRKHVEKSPSPGQETKGKKKKKRIQDKESSSYEEEFSEQRKKKKFREKEYKADGYEFKETKKEQRISQNKESSGDEEKLRKRESDRKKESSTIKVSMSLSSKLLISARSETFPEKLRKSLLKIFENCKDVDVNKFLLPYVVLRDGNLYYRFKGRSSDRKEQYSLV